MHFYKNTRINLVLLCLNFVMCWSQSITPPKITAQGDQVYCPRSQIRIVTDFDIIDPDQSDITDLFIQISEGYKRGEDVLSLPNIANHPNIVNPPKWNSLEGKLTIESSRTGIDAQLDLIAAAKDVVFESSNINISGEKLFSLTIGTANYLPSTGHYYEYIPDKGITWTQAKQDAQDLDYYGLQGYLATITSRDEAQLSGEQAAGAGWIGGSDAAVEGQWKWVTGPEAGTSMALFYSGVTPTGNTITYSFWNRGEPNNQGNEDYAHITAPSIGIKGSWNDLAVTGSSNPNSPYHPQGFIIEYGGMPGDPVLDISAFTRIYIPSLESVENGSSCGPGEVNLTAEIAEISPTSDIYWFESETSNSPIFIGESFLTPILASTTVFYVLASENGCTDGIRTEAIASIYEIPPIQALVVLKNCDEDGNPDGFVDFNLNEADDYISLGDNTLTVSYYRSIIDAENEEDTLNPSPYNNVDGNVVYGRVESVDGCYQVATVELEVSTTNFPPGFDQELVACDDDNTIDGLATFDLTAASGRFIEQLPPDQNLAVQYYRNITDAQLEENEILPQENYISEIPFSQTLFVRVESEDNGDCFGIGPHLVLNVNPRPDFEVTPEAIVCLNLSPITLVTFNATDVFTYEWTDESGDVISTESMTTVSTGGLYTVIATSSSNCESFPKTVFVDESEIATITENDITIIDDSENNTITIDKNNLGIGEYEFALNNGMYQDEPFFDYVEPGIHTIFVRDKNNCGIALLEVAIIGYPKFFTPNNDSVNDTWQVQGISENFYATSLIYIFNQFGKIIAHVDPVGEGWDGFYNGKMQPSSDYWFSVQLIDKNGNVREKQGHFSLITR